MTDTTRDLEATKQLGQRSTALSYFAGRATAICRHNPAGEAILKQAFENIEALKAMLSTRAVTQPMREGRAAIFDWLALDVPFAAKACVMPEHIDKLQERLASTLQPESVVAALKRLFTQMDVADEALDGETYEQKRRADFNIPDDAELTVTRGTLRKVEDLIIEVNKVRNLYVGYRSPMPQAGVTEWRPSFVELVILFSELLHDTNSLSLVDKCAQTIYLKIHETPEQRAIFESAPPHASEAQDGKGE